MSARVDRLEFVRGCCWLCDLVLDLAATPAGKALLDRLSRPLPASKAPSDDAAGDVEALGARCDEVSERIEVLDRGIEVLDSRVEALDRGVNDFAEGVGALLKDVQAIAQELDRRAGRDRTREVLFGLSGHETSLLGGEGQAAAGTAPARSVGEVADSSPAAESLPAAGGLSGEQAGSSRSSGRADLNTSPEFRALVVDVIDEYLRGGVADIRAHLDRPGGAS